MKKITLISLLYCSTVLCVHGQSNLKKTTPAATIAQKIAEAHGISKWNTIEELQFSFNVATDTLLSKRTWSWKPKTDVITLTKSAEAMYTYTRKVMDSTALTIDPGFINDSFWLLFPFKLVWDSDLTYSYIEKATAPISKKEMHQLTITYLPTSGGYTPGDAYDVFFEDDYMLKEWVFRKSNTTTSSMATTWESYETIQGLQIAKMHHIQGSNRKVYFSDIIIK